MNDLRKDIELETIEDLTTRILSLRRRADELCGRKYRTNTSGEFNRRQSQIAKLNARADILHGRRAVMLRNERIAAVENKLDSYLAS